MRGSDAGFIGSLQEFAMCTAARAAPAEDSFDRAWIGRELTPLGAKGDGSGADDVAVETAVNEAYTRGFLDGQELANRECEQHVRRNSASAERAQADAMAAFKAGEIRQLAAQVEAGLARVSAELSEQAAALVLPLVGRVVLREIAADFLVGAQRILELQSAVTVKAKGPEYLLSALKERLEPNGIIVEAAISGQADIELKVDNTRVRTVVGEWLQHIESAQA